jgi:aryl carrier-like protein
VLEQAGSSAALTLSELRHFLQQRLPEYMVPAAFVVLDSLPLSPNGKLDRRALPAPQADRALLVQAYQGPRTPTEQALAEIWAQVLGRPLEQVGVQDNFFELGGDSILSLQVVARAAQRGLRFTPRHVFEHQTIEGLSLVVEASVAHAEAANVQEPGGEPLAHLDQQAVDRIAQRVGSRGRIEELYPLSPMQQGMLFHTLYAPEAGVYVEQVVCQLQGPLDVVAFQQAWQQVVDRHPILRTAFVWDEGSGPLQVVLQARSVGVPFRLLDWRVVAKGEREERLERWLREDRVSGFVLAQGE